jgi:hypothetical protein
MSALDISFRSGMSSLSDLRGAVDANVPVGVVALALTAGQALLTLPGYLNRGGRVFIDSGAFTTDAQFGPSEWDRILICYERVADMTTCPENLYVVAPDQLGEQAGTLNLLMEYRERLIKLIGTGCHVIVPLQCGALPAADMLARVTAILGGSRFVAGIPSNKAAMSIEECATLDHRAFHILGRVQMDEQQQLRIDALRTLNPNAAVTADANWLRSRLSSVLKGTQQVRDTPTLRGLTIDGRAIDHPRAIAVMRAIQADSSWGRQAAPKPRG